MLKRLLKKPIVKPEPISFVNTISSEDLAGCVAITSLPRGELVTAHCKGIIRLWDLVNKECIDVIDIKSLLARHLLLAKDHYVIDVWNFISLAADSNNKLIFSIQDHSFIATLDIKTKTVTLTFTSHEAKFSHALTAKGELISSDTNKICHHSAEKLQDYIVPLPFNLHLAKIIPLEDSSMVFLNSLGDFCQYKPKNEPCFFQLFESIPARGIMAIIECLPGILLSLNIDDSIHFWDIEEKILLYAGRIPASQHLWEFDLCTILNNETIQVAIHHLQSNQIEIYDLHSLKQLLKNYVENKKDSQQKMLRTFNDYTNLPPQITQLIIEYSGVYKNLEKITPSMYAINERKQEEKSAIKP